MAKGEVAIGGFLVSIISTFCGVVDLKIFEIEREGMQVARRPWARACGAIKQVTTCGRNLRL